jgi:hypothetical protein
MNKTEIERFIGIIEDDTKRLVQVAKLTRGLKKISILAYASSLFFVICAIIDRRGSSSQILTAFVTLTLWMLVFKFESDLRLITAIDTLIKLRRD